MDAPAGGHVLSAESPVQGAQREFAEEVGIELGEEELAWLGEGKLENPAGICQRVIEHFYLCTRPVLLEEARFSDEAGGFVEVELEGFLALVEGRREYVAARGRLTDSHALAETQLGSHSLAAYSPAILAEFSRCLGGIRAQLRGPARRGSCDGKK